MNNILGIVMAIMFVLTFFVLPIYIFILGKKTKINRVKSEFNNIYDELLFYYNEEMKKIRKREIFVAIGVILGIMLVVALVIFFSQYINVFEITGAVTIFIIAGTIYVATNNKFNRAYKKEIIERLAKVANSSLEYRTDERYELKKQYKKVNFGDERFSTIYYDDYITGFIEEGVFCLGEVTTYKYKWYRTGLSSRELLFAGVFASINFTNNIKDRIALIDRNNRYRKHDNEYRVDIENWEFENRFNVYSTDENEARNLININFIDDFLRICNEYGVSPDVVIEPNNIFFRFNMGDGLSTGTLFEPGRKPMDREQLSRCYNIIKFTNDLMIVLKNAVDAII